MILAESLGLIAELAIALAGFASIVAIIGRRQARDHAASDAAALRGMLESSLIAAAFALLPLIPFHAGLSEPTTWRVCAATFAAAGGVYGFFVVRRLSRIPGFFSRSQGFFRPVSAAWLILSFGFMGSAWIGLLASAVGWLPKAEVAYLCALYAYLSLSGLLFLRLVMWLLERTND